MIARRVNIHIASVTTHVNCAKSDYCNSSLDRMDTLEDIGKLIYDIPKYIFFFVNALINVAARHIWPSHKCLEGDTILITGTASGIGQELAYQISSRTKNVTLVLWDINETGLLATTEKCRNLGATCHHYKADLCNHDEVMKIAQKVLNEVGQVSILINNAGLAHYAPFLDADHELEEKVFKVNLMSHVWTIRAFLPGMIKCGRGHLVSTVSGVSFYRWKNISSYVASKYGLRGFLETLRLELKQHPAKPNIRISAIYPGLVKTPMSPELTIMEPIYRYKFLEPMECQYVARKIIEGTTKGDEEIIIPRVMRLFFILYSLLPTQLVDNAESLWYQESKTFQSGMGGDTNESKGHHKTIIH